ncbi:Spx/MgsR family RNA polymerase-binding regulatory protein [Pelagibius marinus]|uniref:Spx/MgsR family RNA polymerase-binding regulatory protein n=1 Tax=Pelagibius marinus TaxID=2762760 RepID=UPI0018726B5D|nr:Spx/MgsR family RNA polymerase-binding regulatory protein [Pelagibius marinus]
MIVIYGLKNCDSCRKAVKLLQAAGSPHRFHDLRAEGLPADRLAAWLRQLGWEALLNRRSTTWRELPAAEKADLDAARAADLLTRHPTLIKRPVVEAGQELIVGLAPPQVAALKALAKA